MACTGLLVETDDHATHLVSFGKAMLAAASQVVSPLGSKVQVSDGFRALLMGLWLAPSQQASGLLMMYRSCRPCIPLVDGGQGFERVRYPRWLMRCS